MWELHHKESWVPKKWCLWSGVLEKSLESPLIARRSDQSILMEISPEYSLEGLRLKLKLQYSWPPDAKSWLIRKDPGSGNNWRQEEKGMTEDEMVEWHHWLDGHEFKEALGVGDGQGSLACCSPWIWYQSIVPYPVPSVASWPAYRFLSRQVRWSGIPISWRTFHSVLWSTQSKALV